MQAELFLYRGACNSYPSDGLMNTALTHITHTYANYNAVKVRKRGGAYARRAPCLNFVLRVTWVNKTIGLIPTLNVCLCARVKVISYIGMASAYTFSSNPHIVYIVVPQLTNMLVMRISCVHAYTLYEIYMRSLRFSRCGKVWKAKKQIIKKHGVRRMTRSGGFVCACVFRRR